MTIATWPRREEVHLFQILVPVALVLLQCRVVGIVIHFKSIRRDTANICLCVEMEVEGPKRDTSSGNLPPSPTDKALELF